MAKSDFVDVELSAAGNDQVGAKGAIRFTKRHMNYLFTPGVPVRVLTSEWSQVLSKQRVGGQPLLQLATPAPVSSISIDPEAELTALKAQEAAVEAEIANKKKGGK